MKEEDLRKLATNHGFVLKKKVAPMNYIDWPAVLKKINSDLVGAIEFNSLTPALSYLYNHKPMSLAEMAKKLGLVKQTLYRKMKILGIKLRPKGGPNLKSVSMQPEKFGFTSEAGLIRSYKKQGISIKGISEILQAFGVDISYAALRGRICRLRKEGERFD